MKIDLYFSACRTENGVSYFFDTYREQNRKAVESFLDSGVSDADLEVTLTNRYEDFTYTFEDHALPMKMLLLDVRFAGGSTYRHFADPGKTERENQLNYFEKAFEACIRDGVENPFRTADDPNMDFDAFYGTKGLHFRCYIPKTFVRATFGTDNIYMLMGDSFSADALPKDVLLNNVIPKLYWELGAWDRERLRQDKGEMDYIFDHWIESTTFSLA